MDTVTRRTYKERNNNAGATLQPGSAFSCGTVPDGLYSLGGDVFVYANQWRQIIFIHIRKFNMFGNSYYPPSSVGVAMTPLDFSSLMKDGFDRVRQSMEYWIQDEDCTFTGDFKLHIACSSPEKTVTRQITGQNGRRHDTSIILSRNQWTQFEHISDCVSINAISFLFKEVDLVSRFQTLTSPSVLESDVVYNNQLLYYLKAALITTFLKCGVESYSEETENTIGTFNAACFNLNLLGVVTEFYFNTSMIYLDDGRQLSTCVTSKFLKELDLVALIHDVRNEMCCLEQYL